MDLRSQIQIELSGTLPGKSAHILMAPDAARLDYLVPDQAVQAAVLLLIYQKGETLYIPLIKRMSNNEQDRHRGQISFPGGRKDQSDQSMEETAMRECAEEIGVQKENIQMLGALSSLYIPVSGYQVFPFVAWHLNSVNFNRQESEVEDIIELPIEEILKNENRDTVAFKNISGDKKYPVLRVRDQVIWGATAMILEEFIQVYKKTMTMLNLS